MAAHTNMAHSAICSGHVYCKLNNNNNKDNKSKERATKYISFLINSVVFCIFERKEMKIF